MCWPDALVSRIRRNLTYMNACSDEYGEDCRNIVGSVLKSLNSIYTMPLRKANALAGLADSATVKVDDVDVAIRAHSD
jgi:hypothetical protein